MMKKNLLISIAFCFYQLLIMAEPKDKQTVIDLRLTPSSNLTENKALESKRVSAITQESSQHWLTDLLIDSLSTIEQHPKLQDHNYAKQQIDIDIQKAESVWNPELGASKNYNESERVSFSFTDGAGTVTNTNERSQIDLSKRFDTGTQLNFIVNQNESDNSSADRISRETVNSSMSLAITQNLLKGRSKSSNRFSISELEHNHKAEQNRQKKTLESQLLEFGKMCLELSEIKATLKVRKAHLEIARQERETEKARVEQGLSPQRRLLSHRRNVLDQELDLASLSRRLETLEKEFVINWPGLNTISEEQLKSISNTDFIGELPETMSYQLTRTGKNWIESLDLDQQRVAVMSHRQLDQLDFSLSYNRNGTAQDQSDSWDELWRGNTNEWRLGLNYKHSFGKSSDELNFFSAKVRSNRSIQQYNEAELNWNKSRVLLIEEYHNAVDNMNRRYQLLDIQEKEKAILDQELEEGLVRLEEVFNADKNLLTAKLNIIAQRKQQRLIDLRLKAHDETLLELIP